MSEERVWDIQFRLNAIYLLVICSLEHCEVESPLFEEGVGAADMFFVVEIRGHDMLHKAILPAFFE